MERRDLESEMMNWNFFGPFGYLSILLAVAVPLLWLLHRTKGGTSRWLCTIALLVALVAFAFAKVNSKTHVNRIEPDRTEQVAGLRAQEEAKRQAAEDERGEDVAQIRFAEDGSGDYLDKAGMDEADLKYMDSINATSEPGWKKDRKERSTGGSGDGDLDSMVGGDEAIAGMDADSLAGEDAPQPILMKEADVAKAHKLDAFNLNAIRILILLALVMLVVDYLARANRYAFASRPLPLPSFLNNSFTPLPPIVIRPGNAHREMDAELRWLAKRGDPFVYVTDDADNASVVPESFPRFGKDRRPFDVIHADEVDDDFIFEALWYGRACFVVGSAERGERMVTRFIKLMDERKKVRARVSQSAHVVWDARHPLPQEKTDAYERLAKATGFSMLIGQADTSENT